MAIGAMVCGILAVASLWFCYGIPGLVLGPVAFFLGWSSRRRIQAAAGTLTGGGMALTGMITGAVGFGLGIVVLVIVIGLIGLFASGVLPSPTPSP
jgi:hypothetical protein